MREVVEKAKRSLGDDFFHEYAGGFWGTVSTRSYMRAKQHLGELLAEVEQLAEAIAVFERILELNPDDNQGCATGCWDCTLPPTPPMPAVSSPCTRTKKVAGTFAWARVLGTVAFGKCGCGGSGAGTRER
jgi:hypothetical protein